MSNKLKGKSLRKALTLAYSILLVGSSGLAVLDTLFISKSYTKFSNETTTTSQSANASSTSTATLNTATAYEDDTKVIAIETYGRNVKAKTSTTAQSVNAILAVNGDYYGARDAGYVIRNGQLLRSDSQDANQEDLVIYQDGSFEIIREGDITAQELLNKGAVQVLSFGPALIENSQVAVDSADEVGKAMASNPRTAIGIIDDKHYVLVVSDGRTNESKGLSLKELADFMKELKVTTAYNLDGGGSSTMYFNGQIINKPTTNGHNIEEREVSDIVYL